VEGGGLVFAAFEFLALGLDGFEEVGVVPEVGVVVFGGEGEVFSGAEFGDGELAGLVEFGVVLF